MGKVCKILKSLVCSQQCPVDSETYIRWTTISALGLLDTFAKKSLYFLFSVKKAVFKGHLYKVNTGEVPGQLCKPEVWGFPLEI